jgi:hypothetical protein
MSVPVIPASRAPLTPQPRSHLHTSTHQSVIEQKRKCILALLQSITDYNCHWIEEAWRIRYHVEQMH